MKERPILFSAPMVRAILDGRKTQTRRLVKGRVGFIFDTSNPNVATDWMPVDEDGDPCDGEVRCPYGAPGDRLWVRETWCSGFGLAEIGDARTFHETCVAPVGAPKAPRVVYRADSARLPSSVPWRPSIHMRRADSRLTLEVLGVRVEKLHAISEEDARAEGVEMLPAIRRWKNYIKECESSGIGLTLTTARDSFFSLWEEINGTASLAANPWVWVVTFRRANV